MRLKMDTMKFAKCCLPKPKVFVDVDYFLIDALQSNGESALLMALKKGDVNIVDLLMEYNPIIYAQNDKSMLHYAAEMPNSDLLYTLLVNIHNNELLDYVWEGQTELQIAVKKGYTEHVSLLIMAGADPNAANAVHAAVYVGNMQIVKILIESGKAEVNQINLHSGNIPIYIAAERSDNVMVRYLLSVGANFETTVRHGNRPYELGCHATFFEHGYPIDCNYSTNPNEIGKLIELGADMSEALLGCLQDSDYFLETYRLYLACGCETMSQGPMTELMRFSSQQGSSNVILSILEAGLWDLDGCKQDEVLITVLKHKQFKLFKMLMNTLQLDARSHQVHVKEFDDEVRTSPFVHEIITSDIFNADKPKKENDSISKFKTSLRVICKSLQPIIHLYTIIISVIVDDYSNLAASAVSRVTSSAKTRVHQKYYLAYSVMMIFFLLFDHFV